MINKLLIKDGFVVLPDKIIKADILISGKKIKKIGKNILCTTKNIAVISAKNRYILPGGIDVHTHMELEVWKGMVSSDDFYTGSRAGLKGGITSFWGFAYQKKNETLLRAYRRTYKSASKKSVSNFYLHAGILNTNTDYEKQIRECIKNNIRTFKVHLNDPKVDTVFLMKIFQLVSRYNGILLLHCEDGKIAEYNKTRFIKDGKRDIIYHPRTRENFVEKIAIDLVINLAYKFNTKIYIVHLTTAEGLASIEKAKEEGKIWIEAETCPQYLLLTEKIYRKKQAYLYSCTPPFRTKYDNEMLWKGLKKGIIRVISTDHCPFTIKQKNIGKNDFTKLPYGIPGIETLYPLILSEGRKRGFTYSEITNFISTNPAKIFGIYPERGIIKEGSIADLVIYNPDIKYKITAKDLITNCDFTPYEGWKIKGRIEKVIFEGTPVNF